jgi:4'-phosphopantetheinyl transferase
MIREGEVHVWAAHIPTNAAVECCRIRLPQDEQERAARISHVRARRQFIGARVVARTLLLRHGMIAAFAEPFRYGPRGKPELTGSATFNIAHSGHWIVVAIAPSGALGVDVETRHDGTLQLAARIMSPPEMAELEIANDAAAAGDLVQRCWTAKEAVAKALGLGLAMGFRNVTLARITAGWSLFQWRLVEHVWAAAAIDATGARLRDHGVFSFDEIVARDDPTQAPQRRAS